jgi:ABC-type nickel/cobalt efflux system permease component RcnA
MKSWLWLYLYACWHVLLPGHGKTLLVAVCLSEQRKGSLLRLAAGYGFSHGLLMSLAAMSGLLVFGRFSNLSCISGSWLRYSYLLILLLAFVYFTKKALTAHRHTEKEHHNPEALQNTKRAFFLGLGIGFIPCSDVLGLAAISPMLIQDLNALVPAAITVWLGIVSTVMGLAMLLKILPTERISRHTPDWLPYAGAASICLAALFYKGWTLWQDYHFL